MARRRGLLPTEQGTDRWDTATGKASSGREPTACAVRAPRSEVEPRSPHLVALQLMTQPASTDAQMASCREMMQKPVREPDRYARVWEQHVEALDGAYTMSP